MRRYADQITRFPAMIADQKESQRSSLEILKFPY